MIGRAIVREPGGYRAASRGRPALLASLRSEPQGRPPAPPAIHEPHGAKTITAGVISDRCRGQAGSGAWVGEGGHDPALEGALEFARHHRDPVGVTKATAESLGGIEDTDPDGVGILSPVAACVDVHAAPERDSSERDELHLREQAPGHDSA